MRHPVRGVSSNYTLKLAEAALAQGVNPTTTENTMASKSRSRTQDGDDMTGDAAQAVRDSAQKIWLAGLGAFERAKTEGPRMFETLVEQGRNMGARAVGMADEALKNVREANYAGNRWDKLEQVFEERVSKSLSRLGVLTTREVEDLAKQVRDLNESVQNLMAGAAARATGATGAKAGGGKRRATRKSSVRKGGAKAKAGGAKKARASRASRAPRA
jgi:poly(hydroxyalkanoate) granule-associated protein